MEENKNQTAVEWLQEQLNPDMKTMQGHIIQDLLQQAKAMEKDQIIKAVILSHFEGARQSAKTSKEYLEYGEQYYNQTYEK